MHRPSSYLIAVLSVFALLQTGCVAPPSVYDYTALENSRPRSILVIPPANNSVEVNGSYTFLSTISRPLAEKGYYVFPVAVIDHFLKENGLPTPAEMNGIPLNKIEEHIGADAVLYVSIEDWGQKYRVLTSTTVVHSILRLVDVKTGDLLWEKTVKATRSSDDGDLGPLGAIVIALATQVAGSISDYTADLSSSANFSAIHNPSNGLLHGPYFNPDGEAKWAAVKAHKSPADEDNLLFMGKAAGEIAAKSYDEELWEKALVLAEGNAAMQSGMYIKLRSKQLAEKEKQKEAGEKARLNVDLAKQRRRQPVEILGVYDSIMTSSKGEKTRSVVILAKSGSEIQGKFLPDSGDRVTGILQKNIIWFDWRFADGTYSRVGGWKIKDSRNGRLDGTWETEGGTTGTWKLSKIGPGSAKDIEGLAFRAKKGSLAIYDVSGSYTSRITGLPQSYMRRQNQKAVTLKQNGNKITGSFGSGGAIEGTIEKDMIVFDWDGTYARGSGKWKIQDDGKEMVGSWLNFGGGRDGKWDLIRTDSTPVALLKIPGTNSTSESQPATYFDLSGTYSSTITGINAQSILGINPEVKLTQKGKKVSGTFGTAGGHFWGEIEEGSIKFQYRSSHGGSGSGKWTVEPDSGEIIGKWSSTTWLGSGKWNLTRVQ